MKLIDKSALVAEIEKHLEYANNGILYAQTGIEKGLKKYERDLNAWQHCQSMCKNILSFIDTLEVKDVQEKSVSEEIGNYNHTAVLEGLGYQSKEEPVSDECIYNRTLEEKQRSCKFCSAACQVRIKEPVSEELEKELSAYVNSKEYTNSIGTSGLLLIARHFANWQKQQDQETIELAEDHAMLAGMEKMKEQMVAKAVDGDITFDYYGDGDKTYGCIAHNSFCLEDFGLKDRDKVKAILIKVD